MKTMPKSRTKKDVEGFIGRGYYVIKSSKVNILLFIPNDNISRVISYLNNYVVDDHLIEGGYKLDKVELNNIISNSPYVGGELLYIRYSIDNVPLNHILFKFDFINEYLYINNCKYEYQTIKTSNKYFLSNKENYILNTISNFNNKFNSNNIHSDYNLYFKFLTYKIRSNFNLNNLYKLIFYILNNKNKFNYSFYNLITI